MVYSLLPKHLAMQWCTSLSRGFKIVASMDLVSMVVIDKEPMEIILLTYFEIDSIVVGFNVYQSN